METQPWPSITAGPHLCGWYPLDPVPARLVLERAEHRTARHNGAGLLRTSFNTSPQGNKQQRGGAHNALSTQLRFNLISGIPFRPPTTPAKRVVSSYRSGPAVYLEAAAAGRRAG